MGNVPLTSKTLADLDEGRAGFIIDAAIRRAVADLDERGGYDGKPRKVVITVTLDLNEKGQVESSLEACVKMPSLRTAPTVGDVENPGRADIGVRFSTNSPDDPTQRTIQDVIEQLNDPAYSPELYDAVRDVEKEIEKKDSIRP